MKKVLNDKKIIVLILALLIFTVGYFSIINKVSYAFTDNNQEKNYDKLIEIIKDSAEYYGEKHKDIFKEEKIAYIKIQDLIDDTCLAADENGLVINPVNNETLNSKVIKLKSGEKGIDVEFTS